jgi:hypothetical protein
MDRTAHIVTFARRVEQSAARADWSGLESTDRELAAWLSGLLTLGPFDSAERAALDRLRKVHEVARDKCRREVGRLASVLTELRDRRDGWLAYALEDGLERTEP